MIEIETNKSIKEYKQEYFMGFGISEIASAIAVIIISIIVYLKLPSGRISGYICIIVDTLLLFSLNYKINGLTLGRHVVLFFKSVPYLNKPLVYKIDRKEICK